MILIQWLSAPELGATIQPLVHHLLGLLVLVEVLLQKLPQTSIALRFFQPFLICRKRSPIFKLPVAAFVFAETFKWRVGSSVARAGEGVKLQIDW